MSFGYGGGILLEDMYLPPDLGFHHHGGFAMHHPGGARLGLAPAVATRQKAAAWQSPTSSSRHSASSPSQSPPRPARGSPAAVESPGPLFVDADGTHHYAAADADPSSVRGKIVSLANGQRALILPTAVNCDRLLRNEA